MDSAWAGHLRSLVSAEPAIIHERRDIASQTNAIHLGPCSQYRRLGRLFLFNQSDGIRLGIDSSSQDCWLSLDAPCEGFPQNKPAHRSDEIQRSTGSIDFECQCGVTSGQPLHDERDAQPRLSNGGASAWVAPCKQQLHDHPLFIGLHQ